MQLLIPKNSHISFLYECTYNLTLLLLFFKLIGGKLLLLFWPFFREQFIFSLTKRQFLRFQPFHNTLIFTLHTEHKNKLWISHFERYSVAQIIVKLQKAFFFPSICQFWKLTGAKNSNYYGNHHMSGYNSSKVFWSICIPIMAMI